MHAPSPLSETAMSPGSGSAEGTRLHGRRLVIARVVWVAVVVFTLSIFLLSLPAYFAQLQTVCTGVTCVYAYGQLTPGTAQALQNLGLSTPGYAVSILALAIPSSLVSSLVSSSGPRCICVVWGGSAGVPNMSRYGRLSGRVRRKQSKGVGFGLGATRVAIFGLLGPLPLFPPLNPPGPPFFPRSSYLPPP